MSIDDKDVVVRGRFPRIAKLRSEYYVTVDDRAQFVRAVKESAIRADVLTFVDRLDDPSANDAAAEAVDKVAVMRVSTYQHWFEKQLKFKPRNKLRKSAKAGVVAKRLEFGDELVSAIKEIYDERGPTVQGKRNRHFQKDLETLKREHSSFLDRSEFAGVFYEGEMIGFVKVTHTDSYSILMNIVAKTCHRDKAPSNALIAKTVELCADRKSALLMYGVWGGRGLTEFKSANGFECFDVARHYVPITLRGRVAVALGLHRRLTDILPRSVILLAGDTRRRFARRAGAETG